MPALKKKTKQQNYIISNATEIINKYNTIPTNYVVDYRGKEIVRPYMEQLVNSLGNDIRIAKKNFSTLRVEHSKKLDITGAVGTYNGSENVIKYVKNTASILGHEMLHMASYMYNEQTDTHHHGFMQQKGEAYHWKNPLGPELHPDHQSGRAIPCVQ